jgi:hypothetical protein
MSRNVSILSVVAAMVVITLHQVPEPESRAHERKTVLLALSVLSIRLEGLHRF